MSLKITETNLPGVVIIEPRVFTDPRGFFLETFNGSKYGACGIPETFVQDNHSQSSKGILRGMHYQITQPQGKLIYVVSGEIFDVAVDIRQGSPTFGQWAGVTLSGENKRQLYIPEGFAHGFCVLSDTVDVIYKCTDFYSPEGERGIAWDDPEINIDWPIDAAPLLSEKDKKNLKLSEMPAADLPQY